MQKLGFGLARLTSTIHSTHMSAWFLNTQNTCDSKLKYNCFGLGAIMDCEELGLIPFWLRQEVGFGQPIQNVPPSQVVPPSQEAATLVLPSKQENPNNAEVRQLGKLGKLGKVLVTKDAKTTHVAYLVRLKGGKIMAFEAQTNRPLCALRKRLNPAMFKFASFAQMPVLVQVQVTTTKKEVFISKCKMVGTLAQGQVVAAWSDKPGDQVVVFDVFEHDDMLHVKDVEVVSNLGEAAL